MTSQKFTLNTEAHEAEIGDDLVLKFLPEVDPDVYIEAWAAMTAQQDKVRKIKVDEITQADSLEIIRESKRMNRAFLDALMCDDTKEAFANTKLPDRVITELIDWIMGVYGYGRPTTPSRDSSGPSSPTNSDGGSSTETSQPAE